MINWCLLYKWWETIWTIWTKIGDFKNIELKALPVYDDRYIKIKIRTCSDKASTNFCHLMCQNMI